MAQRKREKELTGAANNSNNASGDFMNDSAGDFHYADGYYFGPGGDYGQQNAPTDWDRPIYGRMDRQSREISRRRSRHGRKGGPRRGSSTPRNEGFTRPVSLVVAIFLKLPILNTVSYVSWGLKSLLSKQDHGPFSHFCTAKPRESR